MSLISKTFSIFKKKFFELFLLNTLFAAVYLLFLVFTRNKIRSYMEILRTLSPSLQQLEGALRDQSAEALSQLESVLSQIGLINTKTLILFWSIPIVTIVFWSLFQGISWMLLSEKPRNVKYFLGRFAVVSAAVFGLLFALSYSTLFVEQSIFDVKTSTFLFNLGAYFFFFYFLYVHYAFAIRNESFLKTLVTSFRVAVFRAKTLVPLFIPLFLLLIAITFIFFNTYTVKIIGTFNFAEILPWAIAFFVFLTAKIWYQIFFVVYIKRY